MAFGWSPLGQYGEESWNIDDGKIQFL